MPNLTFANMPATPSYSAPLLDFMGQGAGWAGRATPGREPRSRVLISVSGMAAGA
jgi:hypothetical protein